jgi:signal transduction histidine kinase
VGGELGLLFFDDGRFRRVTAATGGQFGTIAGIIETADGALWLSEMRGVIRIPPEEVQRFIADTNHTVRYRLFDYLDGLPGAPQMNSTNSTAVEGSDGRLWFATDDGLAWIDPAHLVKNMIPPSVWILSVGTEKGHHNIGNGIKFAAGTRTVEIGYTALSLSIPERVEFRYKLEGVDTDWQSVGTRRQAYYSNLGPGPYAFRVIASNNDGIWNEVGAQFSFEILPPWWSAWWFRAVCAVLVLLMVSAAYSYRLHQIARQFEIRLEERVGERTRIARELHDTLLQGFQGLLLHLQTASSLLPTRPEQAKQKLDSTIDQAAQAITEGRDAVQDLRSSTVETNDLALALRAVGEELSADGAHQNAAVFQVEVEGAPRNLHPILRDEVYRIAAEALRNAFRHAQARRIEVELRYDETQFRLRIRDDGKGIDPKVLGADGHAGHYGLPGMRERATLAGGKLTVWSEHDSGTEVELSIPATIAYAASFRQSWLSEKFFRKGADGGQTASKEADVKETKPNS